MQHKNLFFIILASLITVALLFSVSNQPLNKEVNNSTDIDRDQNYSVTMHLIAPCTTNTTHKHHKKYCKEVQVFAALKSLSFNDEFSTSYRDLKHITGIAVGGLNKILKQMEKKGLIVRYSSRSGTKGKIVAHSETL